MYPSSAPRLKLLCHFTLRGVVEVLCLGDFPRDLCCDFWQRSSNVPGNSHFSSRTFRSAYRSWRVCVGEMSMPRHESACGKSVSSNPTRLTPCVAPSSLGTAESGHWYGICLQLWKVRVALSHIHGSETTGRRCLATGEADMWIVRLALRRLSTCVVPAILIRILRFFSIVRTPTEVSCHAD